MMMSRIIPARAGFTGDPDRHRGGSADHPRSRGVYPSHCPAVAAILGSSPLARGLLGAPQTRRGLSGIIPARAGFTSSRSTRPPSPRDHPRSRGVYVAAEGGVPVGAGSSPLARGLRRDAPGAACTRGIIPARAGFTSRRSPSVTSPPDHPRSRGVYAFWADVREWESGSSPLARGLRG